MKVNLTNDNLQDDNLTNLSNIKDELNDKREIELQHINSTENQKYINKLLLIKLEGKSKSFKASQIYKNIELLSDKNEFCNVPVLIKNDSLIIFNNENAEDFKDISLKEEVNEDNKEIQIEEDAKIINFQNNLEFNLIEYLSSVI